MHLDRSERELLEAMAEELAEAAEQLNANVDELPDDNEWKCLAGTVDFLDGTVRLLRLSVAMYKASERARGEQFEPAPGPVEPELADLDALEWREVDGEWQLCQPRVKIAYGPGGIGTILAYVGRGTENALFDAGLLTLDDVRRAAANGTLATVKGIGPSRLKALHAALEMTS